MNTFKALHVFFASSMHSWIEISSGDSIKKNSQEKEKEKEENREKLTEPENYFKKMKKRWTTKGKWENDQM